MLLVGFLSWWYSTGWLRQIEIVRERTARLIDYFSLFLLLKTLFAPFRQISATLVRGSISDKFRAWVDRTISRLVGGTLRSIVFLIGLIALLVHSVISIGYLLIWPLIPTLWLAGIVMMIMGWTPGWI